MGSYYDIDDADDSDLYRRVAEAEAARKRAVRAATEQALLREAQYRATGWLGEFAALVAACAVWWWLLGA